MSTQFVDNVWLVTQECCNCHCLFAMSADLERRLRKSREYFYCPAGHAQHFCGESPEQKLQRALDAKARELEVQEAATARAKAERDQVARAHTRMRTRVMNGVCPCCNRSFTNLRRHMADMHAGELNLANLRRAFGMTQADVAREALVSQAQVARFEQGRPVAAWPRSRLEAWTAKQAADV